MCFIVSVMMNVECTISCDFFFWVDVMIHIPSPLQAPPRADVVKSLKNGIVLNLLGMGATILGMQATVGLLVAKALTSSANPYYQGISPGYSPVLALDVFLVQVPTAMPHVFPFLRLWAHNVISISLTYFVMLRDPQIFRAIVMLAVWF